MLGLLLHNGDTCLCQTCGRNPRLACAEGEEWTSRRCLKMSPFLVCLEMTAGAFRRTGLPAGWGCGEASQSQRAIKDFWKPSKAKVNGKESLTAHRYVITFSGIYGQIKCIYYRGVLPPCPTLRSLPPSNCLSYYNFNIFVLWSTTCSLVILFLFMLWK